jgi:biopolymer transport protein ExbD
MPRKRSRESAEVNSGSMADIAFLLLIFFLVTTTIASDKGIAILLPPKKENQDDIEIKEKNILNIQINSNDDLLIEKQPGVDEPGRVEEIEPIVRIFVLNNGRDENSSDSPQKAIVSLKSDRGTSYERYIEVYDALKITYNRMRAESLGLTLSEYNELDPAVENHKIALDQAKSEIPFQVSNAEPSGIK